MIVRPKKHLGQHFLVDKNIASNIVGCLSTDQTYVLEIGPGTGVLTELLTVLFPDKLWLIEVDRESVEYLHSKYPGMENRIVEGDFLRIGAEEVFRPHMAIIGNFPYNISSQILFRILEQRNQVDEVVCMLQKEVAQRLASPPGNKTYGILSVLLQAWYDIEYCFTVSEHVFFPPPKVKSAVIRLRRNDRTTLDCNEILFQQVVKKGFNQRRKTLRNALREYLNSEIISDVIFDKRAEQLGLQEFVRITRMLETKSV
jgi:16S rRNA (adenine1518-N6/adenine1519-N6)-dimethyltransferase